MSLLVECSRRGQSSRLGAASDMTYPHRATTPCSSRRVFDDELVGGIMVCLGWGKGLRPWLLESQQRLTRQRQRVIDGVPLGFTGKNTATVYGG
jgi:hypothetical protein